MHRIDGDGNVSGKWVAEDTAAGRPPTAITADFMNAVQEELAVFIEWAGVALKKTDNTQLRQALQKAFYEVAGAQKQSSTAFTTAGTPPAFTVTTLPAYGALAAGQRMRLKFHASAQEGVPATLSRDGTAGKSLKQYDGVGNKLMAAIRKDMLADVEYDGTDYVVLDALPSPKVPVTRDGLRDMAFDPYFDNPNAWNLNAGSYSFDTANFVSGSRSLKAVGAATLDATNGLFPVSPGESFLMQITYKTTADWNGAGNTKMRFSDQNGTLIVAPTLNFSSNTNGGWNTVAGRYTVPLDGSVTAMLGQVMTDGSAGAVWVDSFHIYRVSPPVRFSNWISLAVSAPITLDLSYWGAAVRLSGTTNDTPITLSTNNGMWGSFQNSVGGRTPVNGSVMRLVNWSGNAVPLVISDSTINFLGGNGISAATYWLGAFETVDLYLVQGSGIYVDNPGKSQIYSRVTQGQAAGSLVDSQMGSAVGFSGDIVLPKAAAHMNRAIHLYNTSGANSATITPAGGDYFYHSTTGLTTVGATAPITLEPGQDIVIAAPNSTTDFSRWNILGGSWVAKNAVIPKAFPALFNGQNGYQKLSSGLILQWGLTAPIPYMGSINVTFPIAFTKTVVFASFVPAGSTINVAAANMAVSATLTGMSSENPDGATALFYWLAIGL